MTSEYRTQIIPVAAKANGMQMSIYIVVRVIHKHTDVLGYAELFRWPVQVLQACSNQTPLHYRGPKEHGLGTYWCKRGANIVLVSMKQEILGHEPAGWFINAENREAPADAAAPDMLFGQEKIIRKRSCGRATVLVFTWNVTCDL